MHLLPKRLRFGRDTLVDKMKSNCNQRLLLSTLSVNVFFVLKKKRKRKKKVERKKKKKTHGSKAMLCIVAQGLQSKCITTPSLNMAITGQFLCCTSLLDSGLTSRGILVSLEKQTANFGVLCFGDFFVVVFMKRSPAQPTVLKEQRKCLHYAYLHFFRSPGLESSHSQSEQCP